MRLWHTLDGTVLPARRKNDRHILLRDVAPRPTVIAGNLCREIAIVGRSEAAGFQELGLAIAFAHEIIVNKAAAGGPGVFGDRPFQHLQLDENGFAVCPESNERYKLENGVVSKL